MSPVLFDPGAAREADWPPGRAAERAYLETVARLRPAGVAANVSAGWLALASDGRLLPVTVNGGERGGSYVCLPHSAYALYALREMELVRLAGRRLLAPLVRLAGRLMLAAGLDRIVHVDNWLLSTNLHGDWEGRDIAAIRALLAARFPGHVLAVRSVDPWSSPQLLEALRADGWTLVPSRQIWVTDDLARDWRPRNAYGNDRRALARSGLSVEAPDRLGAADAVEIAERYRQLYVGRYSALNPVFTPAFVAGTCASGLVRYRLARDAGGTIRAVAGLLTRAGVATPPVVGYDTDRPRGEGLYRIASFLFMEAAMREGARLHASAGAAHFKRLRGGRGVIEYWAMHAGHLAAPRRLAIAALAGALERWVVPLMREKGW